MSGLVFASNQAAQYHTHDLLWCLLSGISIVLVEASIGNFVSVIVVLVFLVAVVVVVVAVALVAVKLV